MATPSGSAPKQQMAPSHAASGGVGWTPAAKVQERSAAARAAGQIEVRQGALDRGRPFAQGHSQRSNVRPDPVTATEQAEADALVEAYNLPDDVIAAAEQNNSELPEDVRNLRIAPSHTNFPPTPISLSHQLTISSVAHMHTCTECSTVAV